MASINVRLVGILPRLKAEVKEGVTMLRGQFIQLRQILVQEVSS